MWGAFFSLQLLCQMTLYETSIPSNSEIYVEQFRKLVDFELFKPDHFLKLINEDWSILYFWTHGNIKMNAALQSSGIQSGNIMLNL